MVGPSGQFPRFQKIGPRGSLTLPPVSVTLPNMAKTPDVKVDAINVLVTGLSAIVVLGTLKVVAIRFHGHKLAQAYLTLF